MTPDLFTLTLTDEERQLLGSLALSLLERLYPDEFDEEETLASRIDGLDDDERAEAADKCVRLLATLAPEFIGDE